MDRKDRFEFDFDIDDDDNSRRKPFDQDADADYDEIYGKYERDHKSGRAPGEEKLNISSFSDRPVKKPAAPQRKQPAARSAKGESARAGKKTKKKRGLIVSVCAALVILGVVIYLLWPLIAYNRRIISGDPDDLGFEYVISKDVTNIALFGLDTRDVGDFTGRSDSIMILSLNKATKKVKVISLMRDTIIKMENKGKSYYSKFNNAYFDGGPELAIKTINQNFGLDISNYATINFYGMVDIIDAVGGIDATVTEDELTWQGEDMPNLNNCMNEICENMGLDLDDYLIHEAGPHHMNGVQAVAYSRIRHCMSTFGTTDDFGRTDRQRHVMEQLFQKAITLKKTDYLKLARALLPCSETSLGFNEIVSLAIDVLLKNPTFVQCRVPQMEWLMPFNYPEFGSCVYFDMDYAKRAIHAVIYEDMTVDQFVEQHPVEKDDWFARIYGTPAAVPAPEPDETPASSGDGSGTDNSGSDNSGSDNSGSDNSGSDNSGASGLGSDGEVSTPLDTDDSSSNNG